MLTQYLLSLFMLPAAIRTVAVNGNSTSAVCNNSPSLCSKSYSDIAYLGAHDSPFVRDASTDYSTSGNQYYNSTVQLSAGVRLLTAQVQLAGSSGSDLHVCHTSCDLLDAGSLPSWLGEIRTWMEANPSDVVTILLVNRASASGTDLAAAYQSAGISTDLAYTPSSTLSTSQRWPTLQSLIDSGTRLINFVDSIDDNSAATFLMPQYSYIFENNYDVSTPSLFSCVLNRPDGLTTTQALSNKMMALMNHFLYSVSSGLIEIQSPNATYDTTTNAPSGGVGNLGAAAASCAQYYGRAPSFIVVDFFNVGPAIATVDRLNGVTNAVGRTTVSRANEVPASFASNLVMPQIWTMWSSTFVVALLLVMR